MQDRETYYREADSFSLLKPQRNLNNAFAYDLVPAPSVIVAALRAARRVNDFPTAVRIFEGAKFPSIVVPPIFIPTLHESEAVILTFFFFFLKLQIGIKAKVENKMQYEEYVKELEPLREELGVPLKESLYPDLP